MPFFLGAQVRSRYSRMWRMRSPEAASPAGRISNRFVYYKTMNPIEFEKREFIRIKCVVPVRYKFLSKIHGDQALDGIYEGTTSNISGGGILLNGAIQDPSWIADLLTRKILIGVNVLIAHGEFIKALGRVAWIESIDMKTCTCNMGIKFNDIATEDRDRLFRFVIKSQIP